jgi:hypothetical protein
LKFTITLKLNSLYPRVIHILNINYVWCSKFNNIKTQTKELDRTKVKNFKQKLSVSERTSKLLNSFLTRQ